MPNEPEDRNQKDQPVPSDDDLIGRGDEADDEFDDVEDIDETEEFEDVEDLEER